MPAIVTSDKMSVGEKGTGKHWTIAQVEARQSMQEKAKREKRAMLKPPEWLDEKALEIWEKIKRAIRGLEILDNIDANLLAIYCDAVARYAEQSTYIANGMIADKDLTVEDITNLSKSSAGYARLAVSLGDKLGFTPNGRARLVKRKSERIEDKFSDSFDK